MCEQPHHPSCQVVCDGAEVVCQNIDGSRSCSLASICGLGAAAINASASMSGGIGPVTPSSSNFATATTKGAAAAAASAGDGWSPTAPPVIPTLTLIGRTLVRIQAGSAYGRCPTGIIAGCDQGVRVTPAELSAQVIACEGKAVQAGVLNPMSYASVGIVYCRVNSSNPGTYEVRYRKLVR